jgi:hypothetical protein
LGIFINYHSSPPSVNWGRGIPEFLRNLVIREMTYSRGVPSSPDSITSGKEEQGTFEQMGLSLKECFTPGGDCHPVWIGV